jgi:hypothetical protein
MGACPGPRIHPPARLPAWAPRPWALRGPWAPAPASLASARGRVCPNRGAGFGHLASCSGAFRTVRPPQSRHSAAPAQPSALSFRGGIKAYSTGCAGCTFAGASSVTLGGRRCCRRGDPFIRPSAACAGIRGMGGISRPEAKKPLDFRKYSDYDSKGRLNVLRMGRETHVRAHRGSFPGPLFPRNRVRGDARRSADAGEDQAAARYNKTESDTSLKP